ncbi:MAG: FkbM family methyltransferase [Acidimicrobiales bacterium]|nr:FkbM family methyltransferase [Acidimicrobiales bacterium]
MAIRKVLDIGGNIGQFATSVLALNPELERIDVFEPNPEIFDTLEKNLSGLDRVRCFNFGIGPNGPAQFHFTPGYSVVGSILSENAKHREASALSSIEVQLISDISSVTGNSAYDLVKIDVEGFEYEVVEAIRGLSFRYLYIEFTGRAKEKSHATSELHAMLRERFGPYEVLYQAAGNRESTIIETLLEFVGE